MESLCTQACVGAPLGRLAMFSSVAALTGPAGSASYAAANAVLDQWCQLLHAQGAVFVVHHRRFGQLRAVLAVNTLARRPLLKFGSC